MGFSEWTKAKTGIGGTNDEINKSIKSITFKPAPQSNPTADLFDKAKPTLGNLITSGAKDTLDLSSKMVEDSKTIAQNRLERVRQQITLAESIGDFDTATALQPKLKELEKLTDGVEGKLDKGQLVLDTVQSGVQQVAKAGSSALAFAEGLVTRPIDYVMTGGQSTPLTDSGVFHKLNEDIDREMAAAANRHAANVQAGGSGAKLFYDYGAATVAAVPQALVALATAGGSLATKGLQVAQAAPGVMSSIHTVASQATKNPTFWTSFLQTVGGEYEEAKKRGANEVAATLEALTAGTINAAVEVGGGLETLPNELQGGAFTVRKWIETMVDEGREEVVQGVLSRGFQTLAAGDNAPLFSTTDPNAVFNPVTAAQEFAGGAVVGGILGGAQGVAANIMNSVAKSGNQPTVDNPASPVYNNTDKSTQQTIEKAQSADLGQPVSTKTATVLDTGTTAYVQLGMKPKRAEAKAKVVQKLINGEEVSLDGMKSLNLTDAKYREIFTQLTGVVFPEGMTNHDQLMNVAKTASEVRNNVAPVSAVAEEPIVPMAEPVIAQDIPQPVAQMSDEVGTPLLTAPLPDVASYEQFADAYRQSRNAEAGDAELAAEFSKYLNKVEQARDMESVEYRGRSVSRKQFREMFRKQNSDTSVSDAQLNEVFDRELSRQTVTRMDAAPDQRKDLSAEAQKTIGAFEEKLGITVKVQDKVGGPRGKSIRGKFDPETRTLYIAKNARGDLSHGDVAMQILRHELTHYLKTTSPEAYAKYVEFVRENVADYQAAFEAKAKAYKGIIDQNDTGVIEEELAAEYAEKLFNDEEFIRLMVKQDRSLAEKIYEAIKALLGKLTGEGFDSVRTELTEAQKLWADMLEPEKTKNTDAQTFLEGARYSVSKYWRPDLSKAEWALLNRSLETDLREGKNFLDKDTKWLYTESKGTKVFAIYGFGDGSEATVLYASGGDNAYVESLLVDDVMWEVQNGTVGTAEAYYRWFKSMRSRRQRHRSGDASAENRGATVGDGRVSEHSGGRAAQQDGDSETGVQTELPVNSGVSYDEKTESVSPTRFSLDTWNESDYVTARADAAKAMSETLGITQKKAKAYIDSVNSIANMIANDRVRLDYEASPGRSSFVGNAEYGGSIDFSTICKKRRLFTGTFEAIQKALPNTALTAEEFLEIRSMMDEKGYEVSCGLCYVEGSRANMGQYAKQFLEQYEQTSPEYMPNMAEINTPSGLERIRADHPEVYTAYEKFMNGLAQRKPKLYQTATAYQGEVLSKFGRKGSKVAEKNQNGGLRIQSFSDFEIIHLIDSMQVIMDMSRVGLAGQAYTKVPDFAWALGDTGLKINLSLIAKDVDDTGRLVLDEKEGMSAEDAFTLRGRYSENVGTVLVVFTDEQLKAALADSRIDYIIPFHRSQWRKDQYESMGLPANAKDYTMWQNESYIKPVLKNGKKQRPENFMPNTYWDFSKTGKENAEAYLKMCAEDNRKPKFSHLLVDNKDGSYSLQPDGSTDGYWKLLIDFKMYDNDGKGIPQRPVRPDFNMEQANRMLEEYKGGHSRFPAADDVVSEFVEQYKRNHPDVRYSVEEIDEKPFRLDDYTIDDLLNMSDEEMERIYRELGMDPNFELDDSILLDDDFSIDSFSEELNVEPEVVEILFRRAGLGNSHVEANRMAVMTQDRIDKRIGEHGSSNPDYARRYITRIAPKDFIDLTVYERNMARDKFDANVGGDLGSKMGEWDYEKQLRDSEEPPVLIVDKSSGQIIGHNGRHRVRALELAGIESVEIEVQFHDADGYMVKYGAETIPGMAISSQFDTKIETHIPNIIPLNKAHRAEIMESYGETAHKDAGVRYAVDETDSEGKALSKQQVEFFKDSVVRDENGKIIPVYHGTPAGGFTEFKLPKYLSGLMNAQGAGFYFTDEANARQYMRPVNKTVSGRKKLYKTYLNITNPLVIKQDSPVSISKEQFKDIIRRGNYEWFRTTGMPFRAGRNSEERASLQSAPFEEVLDLWTEKVFRGAYYDSDVLADMTQAFKGGDEILSAMKEVLGYDGVQYVDRYGDIWVAWSPEQIKNVTNKKPTENPDIRYSLSDDFDAAVQAAFEAAYQESLKNPAAAPASQADSGMTGFVVYNRSAGAAALRFDPYTYLLNEYGAIEQTGSYHRVSDVPKSTNGKDKVTKTTTTVMGAKVTPESRLTTIAEAVVDGELSYEPTKNKVTENRMRRKLIRNGWDDSLKDWTQAVHEGKASADLVAMGATLLNNAGNSGMDGKAYIRLMSDYSQLLNNAGQTLQAANILKKMSPEGKLYAIQKQIDQMNESESESEPRHNTGLPVSLWMDEVGELLADELYRSVDVKESRESVKSVADTILDDLYRYAKELVAKESPSGKPKQRTEMERLHDMFHNKDKYEEAWQVAKNRLKDEFGNNPEMYAALENWLNSELTIADKLTDILTGQKDIVMDEALAERYLNAKTEDERDAVMEAILQNLADQVPASWVDKFQAWRYTAMLGNLRAPIRNTLGNTIMGVTALGKRAFAGIVEAGMQKAGILDERTTSLLRDKETLTAAKDDFKTVKDLIAGGGKYQDGKDQMNLQTEIKKRQRVFKNAALEGWRTSTQWIMENDYFGDVAFSRVTYADALARYIAANGTTWSQASDELKDKARTVAIREAAEATFRDTNQFSQMVSGIGKVRHKDNIAEKAIHAVVEGTLPFKKTPANILVRATEYSPAGLVNGVIQAGVKAAGKGDVSANEIIDNFCKGMTGSAILGLGMLLADLGLLQGSAPDDEKEKELWEMQGHQKYAIEFTVDGKQYSYTIDWVSPVSIPLLVGAELYEAMQSKGLTKREMTSVGMAIFDPMLEMSMLQGLNDALSNAQTWGDEAALTKFVGNAIWGYMTQFIPTLLGQAERASVNTRMTTYADNNKDIPDGVQRLVGRASAKIPGIDVAQTYYMDAWGRTQANASSTTLNIIEQFLSPGYANAIVESDTEKELLRLKQATGESGVLIASAPKYFNVEKVRKDLTAAEYLTYAKTRGQTAYSLLTEMTAGTTYNGMPDVEKVYAVERAYDYSNQIAKELVTQGKYEVEKWVGEARTLEAEYGVDVTTYLTAYASTKDMTSLKDKGETVDNSLALKKANYILSIPGLTDEQRVALADTLGCNQTVLGWLKRNPKVIPKKLEAMEKKYG